MRRSGPTWVYVGGVQQASEHFVERTTPQNIILDDIRPRTDSLSVRSHPRRDALGCSAVDMASSLEAARVRVVAAT